MATITDVVANFGDVFELSFDPWAKIPSTLSILQRHSGWQIYNPRKPGNNRFGLSITSVDGGFSGIPDLDSLREYNSEHGKSYAEHDFRTITPIVNHIPEAKAVIEDFGIDYVGRCHFLRLDKGGFFPPHRDNGRNLCPYSLRILVPLVDFTATGSYVWLQEGKPLELRSGRTYFINTTKIHSLFSFEDGCYMAVYNLDTHPNVLGNLVNRSRIL
jgi:hypothetical protein